MLCAGVCVWGFIRLKVMNEFKAPEGDIQQ